ncbi:unnamed protein product [Protopolystoma xenopodis]|uniref:Uncharacterized protein n=1 Tax=Protopolystoma xenopodis TaxID=117903 RepID=A0A3S5FEL1_9PLAT|nr:unnamed protein product [Protopolystoma xenopodis]
MAKEAELNNLQMSIEKEHAKRLELDGKITQELRNRLTMKKAAEYVKKLTTKVEDQSRELETKV